MRERESKLFHFTLVAWTHFLCFLLMAVHDCADAQAGTSSTPPYSFGLRENMGASFTVMVVAFLSAFAFMGFFTLYLRHCTHMYVATVNPISAAAELCRHGCNQQVIDNCPIIKYSTVREIKMGKEALECAVCLAEFQDYDRLRLLPKCNHVFHPDCIDAWLSSHVTCPLCRAKLTSDCGKNLTQLLPGNVNEPQHPQNSSTRTPESASAGEMELHQVAVEVLPGSDQQLPATSIAINPVENVTQVFDLNQIQTPRPPPPLGFRLLLETLPRSHSTGHSLLEVEPERGNYLDRYTLRLPEHVRKQRLPTGDIVLPDLWSPRRGWNGSEMGEAGGSRQLPAPPLPSVSSSMTPVKLEQASEGGEEQLRLYRKLNKPMSEQPPEIPLQSLNGFHCPPL